MNKHFYTRGFSIVKVLIVAAVLFAIVLVGMPLYQKYTAKAPTTMSVPGSNPEHTMPQSDTPEVQAQPTESVPATPDQVPAEMTTPSDATAVPSDTTVPAEIPAPADGQTTN